MKCENVKKAIELVKDYESRERDIWLRPSFYAGLGVAFALQGDYLMRVPDKRGGSHAILKAGDLKSTWEVVEPDRVLDEHERIIQTMNGNGAAD